VEQHGNYALMVTLATRRWMPCCRYYCGGILLQHNSLLWGI